MLIKYSGNVRLQTSLNKRGKSPKKRCMERNQRKKERCQPYMRNRQMTNAERWHKGQGIRNRNASRSILPGRKAGQEKESQDEQTQMNHWKERKRTKRARDGTPLWRTRAMRISIMETKTTPESREEHNHQLMEERAGHKYGKTGRKR